MSPASLAELPPKAGDTVPERGPCCFIRACWGIARCTFPPSSSSNSLVRPHQEFTGHLLAKAIQKHMAQFSKCGTIRARLPPKLKAKRHFANLGPMQKTQHLAKADALPAAIDRFCIDATHANLLKQVRGSLPSLCSALRCYVAFCEMRKITPFPPTDDTVAQWRCVRNNTSTYGNYFSHLQKCRRFLKFPTSWFAPCVRHVAKGLEKCQNRIFRFRKFIRSSPLAKIVELESAKSEFGQASCLSLFPILSSSSCGNAPAAPCLPGRQSVRAPPHPHPGKALIGVSTVGGEAFLAAKFSHRKNLPGGCILRRPCFCFVAKSRAELCTIHIFWAAVRRRVPRVSCFSAL